MSLLSWLSGWAGTPCQWTHHSHKSSTFMHITNKSGLDLVTDGAKAIIYLQIFEDSLTATISDDNNPLNLLLSITS